MTTSTLVNEDVSETFPTLLQSSISNFFAGTSTKTTSTILTTSTTSTSSMEVPIEPEFEVIKTSQMTIKAFDYTTETTSTTTTTTTRKTYPTRPFKKSNFSQTNLILSLLIIVFF